MPLARVTVDLAAVRRNFRRVAEVSGKPVLAVVKADAYGHGASEVASALLGEAQLYGLVVARLEEALALRSDIGPRVRILVLSCGLSALDKEARRAAVSSLSADEITPVVGSRAELEHLANEIERAATGRLQPMPIHLEVDTGMSRSGIDPGELESVLERIHATDGLRLEGLFSHLAESETYGSECTRSQRECFQKAIDQVDASDLPPVAVHLANSAAALHLPATVHSLVRVGGALFGLDLALGNEAELEPAMCVESRVTAVREIAAGTAVGYGRTWVAQRPTTTALVAMGYADGYPTLGCKRATDQGRERDPVALIAAQPEPSGVGATVRASVIGAVSMDLLCLDVTGHAVGAGDRVVLLGSLGADKITPFDLAGWSGQVPYEVTCRFSRRLQRSFVDTADI